MGKIIITCPYCGYAEETDKIGAIQSHRCGRCKRDITARKADHCVVCSYGSENCGEDK